MARAVVVPAAGRQLREAGQRPALPGDPRCTGMGSESLPAARDPTPKPSASSQLAWPAQGGSAGRWPAIAGSRPAAGSTRIHAMRGWGQSPCLRPGIRPQGHRPYPTWHGRHGGECRPLAGNCGKPASGRPYQEIHAVRGWGQSPCLQQGIRPQSHRPHPNWHGRHRVVVPAAGRQLREAGQRPALPGSTPCVDGVRALACGQGSDPKAIGLIPPGMAGTGGSAGRWPAIAGSRPAAGPTRRSTLYGDGVRVLACSKGSDPKAIGLIPPGMAGTGW